MSALPPDASRVLLLVPDPHARFAAVELSREFVEEEVLTGGYGLCTYVFAWTPEREPVESLSRYLGGYGDLRMRPDLGTVTPVEEGVYAVVCDVEWPDGEPVRVAPRQVLRDELDALEALGFVPSVGIEHEVTFSDADGPLTPHGVDYAVGGTERLRPLLRDLRARLAPLRVESARGECHPGQYEIVLRHRKALSACDDAMLQQLLVRTTAAEHGVTASYLAAPETGQGNSCHVHLSLSPPALEPFLAGVLREARALTAIWAPTWNSYVRLRTGPFSPRSLRWGTDDRTAAVRIAGSGASRRLEFRFAGADAQPHLVVAALLAAGRAGIEENLAPPPEGEEVGTLCATPWEALAALSGTKVLGGELVEQQSALLQAEIDAGCDAVTDWQRRRGALRA
ncbi:MULTISPECIES: glutamine synthetase [Amycolatopsis]|uniref:Glutamine synthetase n=2 Tax=Amycolatopsis TaxID=1813 RepID=A0A1I3QVQ7_9PSEU|nr:glutamine synthetase [Amycolatopsis sacchari]SFJ37985.1 glutamine synthetase [Amycolatopsis sacchari]